MVAVAVPFLETWFVARVRPEVRAWFGEALAEARRAGIGGDKFPALWSGAGRRLGREVVTVTADEAEQLRAAGAGFVPAGWGADELGRGLLLLAAAEATTDPQVFFISVDDLFRMGEMREQQAILRVLAHLPGPERYAALAADAVRINVLTVIEALACDNPFPAAHMGELAFNQMVMKAIFNELSLARVVGLGQRNNPELRRMVAAYASERRAAGRPVPADTDLVSRGV
jgi:hypothetical protein